MRSNDDAEIRRLLALNGWEAISRKGGGYWIRRHGEAARPVTVAQARRLVGMPASQPRVPRPRVAAWGDWATVAMLNQPRKGG